MPCIFIIIVTFIIIVSILSEGNKKNSNTKTVSKPPAPMQEPRVSQEELKRRLEAKYGKVSTPKREEATVTDYLEKKYENNEDGVATETKITDYLEKKYEEPERKEFDVSGPFGKRVELGEGAKNGEKIKNCSYCNAENAVPRMYSGKYKCYFCHRDL